MIGRMRLMAGSVRVAEPEPFVHAVLATDELRLLADTIERQSAGAEMRGDMVTADRLAARASDLRLKARHPAPSLMPLRRPIPRHSTLIAATWPGAGA